MKGLGLCYFVEPVFKYLYYSVSHMLKGLFTDRLCHMTGFHLFCVSFKSVCHTFSRKISIIMILEINLI